jgi:hypothetical protein
MPWPAIRAIFEGCGMAIPSEPPPALGEAFAGDGDKQGAMACLLKCGAG